MRELLVWDSNPKGNRSISIERSPDRDTEYSTHFINHSHTAEKVKPSELNDHSMSRDNRFDNRSTLSAHKDNKSELMSNILSSLSWLIHRNAWLQQVMKRSKLRDRFLLLQRSRKIFWSKMLITTRFKLN